ncbi:hypothetical protein M8R20_46110 [Pseudomonas sp. R2.Fl]|nr:hypothetical protein [Pseudomonas sp. R2.Fl]MCL6714366.1 hypothetical protein [Pseudomonas sp. R2.Fl]
MSERLEAHAKRAASRAHWAEVGGEDSDSFWKAFAADLDAAAKLARRVEEAPVEIVVSMPGFGMVAFTREWVGKRVRLVKEE